MKKKSTSRLGWRTFSLITVLILIVAFLIYFPSYSRYRELQSEADQLQLKYSHLQEEIQKLKQEKELIQTDKTYLETVIRKEMGLVEPGEVVYEFSKGPARQASTQTAEN